MTKLKINDDDYTSEFDQLLLGIFFLFDEIMQLDSEIKNE